MPRHREGTGCRVGKQAPLDPARCDVEHTARRSLRRLAVDRGYWIREPMFQGSFVDRGFVDRPTCTLAFRRRPKCQLMSVPLSPHGYYRANIWRKNTQKFAPKNGSNEIISDMKHKEESLFARIRPNAEWDGVRWGSERLWEFGKPFVIPLAYAITQRVRDLHTDWIGLGILFLLSLLVVHQFKKKLPPAALKSSAKMNVHSDSSNLVIHSAIYQASNGEPYDVTEFLRHVNTGDSLVFQIENHNFVFGKRNYVPKDPAPFLPKSLKVQYSYGQGPIFSVERPEHSRLVLPEDTFLKSQESLNEETVRRLEAQHKSDLWRAQEARQHCEEERSKALQRIEELEADTIDRERPEIFLTLIFGPGRVGVGSIGIQNRGTRDALNVTLHPTQLEDKRLTFPEYACIPKRDSPEYPQIKVNGVTAIDTEEELAGFLRRWCQNWGKDKLHFTLTATWFDSRSNEFRSASKVTYDPREDKCRTVLGFIERIMPDAP
jgi:hypothetical protein